MIRIESKTKEGKYYILVFTDDERELMTRYLLTILETGADIHIDQNWQPLADAYVEGEG